MCGVQVRKQHQLCSEVQVLSAPVGCFELLGADGRWRPAAGNLKALKPGAPRTAVSIATSCMQLDAVVREVPCH